MRKTIFIGIFLALVSTAHAQTVTPSGVLVYGQINLVNTQTATGTGLTNDMSNASVREFYLEFDDATQAPNTLTTPFTTHLVLTGTTNGDKVGGVFNTWNNSNSQGGFILGSDTVVGGAPGSSAVVMAGMQLEVMSAGAMQRRYGLELTIDPGSTTQGQQMDAAIAFDNIQGGPAPRSNLFTIGDPEGTAFPLGGGANVFHVNANAPIANFCDCAGLTMSGYIFNFGTPFQVTGAGWVKSEGYSAAGSPGVSCSGPLSAGAVVQNGIITHC